MVSVHRGACVEADVRGADPARLDVDGEALGALPIRVEVLPRAIGLFGVPPGFQAKQG